MFPWGYSMIIVLVSWYFSLPVNPLSPDEMAHILQNSIFKSIFLYRSNFAYMYSQGSNFKSDIVGLNHGFASNRRQVKLSEPRMGVLTEILLTPGEHIAHMDAKNRWTLGAIVSTSNPQTYPRVDGGGTLWFVPLNDFYASVEPRKNIVEWECRKKQPIEKHVKLNKYDYILNRVISMIPYLFWPSLINSKQLDWLNKTTKHLLLATVFYMIPFTYSFEQGPLLLTWFKFTPPPPPPR